MKIVLSCLMAACFAQNTLAWDNQTSPTSDLRLGHSPMGVPSRSMQAASTNTLAAVPGDAMASYGKDLPADMLASQTVISSDPHALGEEMKVWLFLDRLRGRKVTLDRWEVNANHYVLHATMKKQALVIDMMFQPDRGVTLVTATIGKHPMPSGDLAELVNFVVI